MMEDVGKLFLVIGLLFVIIGIVWTFGGKYLGFGKLPGDIAVEKENFRFYFPLASSIILSIILSLLLWIFFR